MTTLFFILLKLNSYCHSMVFQSDGARDLDFAKYVLQKNQQTYTQWHHEQASTSNAEPHVQVIDFSQRVLSGPKNISKQLREDWETLRNTMDLNSADREVLMLLAEKVDFKTEYCRYYLMNSQDNRDATARDCTSSSNPVPNAILKKLRPKDLLIIDGQIFNIEQIPKHLVPGSYQWKIISNQYIDISFIGSAEKFAQQNFRHERWVDGSCDSYKLNHTDFSVLSQAKIFFDEHCVQSGLRPEKTVQDWMKEHKKLVFAIGLVVGGLAAYQLRDKTLVISPH